MPIKLLIFDLDGTLIDSAPDIIATTNQLMAARGKPALPEAQIIAAIGEGLKHTVFSLFPEAQQNPDELERLENDFYGFYEKNLLEHATIYPGVLEFLDRCQQKIAIVTNKYKKLTDQTLSGLPLKNYPWLRVFGSDSLPRRKPDPLPLLEVMKAAGVARQETLMIGDGIPDMMAARRAGVHAVAAEFGYTPLEILKAQGASLSISGFSQLSHAIQTTERLPAREVESQ